MRRAAATRPPHPQSSSADFARRGWQGSR